MSEPLTPEQVQRTMNMVNDFMSQFFDGYSVVGFHVGSGQPFSFRSAMDAKTAFALNGLLQNAACAPIVIPGLEPPEDGKIAD